MDFKFLTSNDLIVFSPTGDQYYTFVGSNHRHGNNEFCMQFDDDEPLVIGQGNSDLYITLNPTANSNITFTHNGKRFKIFAREVQI